MFIFMRITRITQIPFLFFRLLFSFFRYKKLCANHHENQISVFSAFYVKFLIYFLF